MEDIDKEFEEAAEELANAELCLRAQDHRNVSVLPVERKKQVADYHDALGRLHQAQDRMDRARQAKYPTPA